jgi:hypothetical protein
MVDVPESRAAGSQEHERGTGARESEDVSPTDGAEVLTGDAAPAEAVVEEGPWRRRWPWVVAIAAAILLGGSAWALVAVLGGGGPQPAEALPAGVDAYFRIDLDPSAGQKLAARELASRFPALEDVADDLEGDLKRVIYDIIAEQDPDFAADVDFDEDLAPWLGDRVGVGLILDDPGVPVALVAVQVTDGDAAAEALPRLFDEEDVGLVAYAFAGDYVVFAEDQATADQAVADAADESLADNELFTEVHGGLGDPGVASMWLGADLDELFGTTLTAQGPGEVEAAPAGFTEAAAQPELGELTMAAALRLDADHIELAGQAILDTGSIGDVATGVGSDLDAATTLGRLPATTLFGLVFAGVDLTAEQRQDAWDQMMSGPAGSGFDPDQLADDLEESLGVVLPDALFDLLSNDITVVLDASVLDVADPLDPADFAAALVFDLSGDAGEQAVVKLVDLIEESGLGLAVDNDGERAVITFSEGYLDQLTGATDVELLSDTEAAARALGTEGPVSAAFYLDAGGLADAAAEGDGATDAVPEDILANLEAIEAVGLTAWQEEREDALPMGHFNLRVTLVDG